MPYFPLLLTKKNKILKKGGKGGKHSSKNKEKRSSEKPLKTLGNLTKRCEAPRGAGGLSQRRGKRWKNKGKRWKNSTFDRRFPPFDVSE